MNEQDILTPKEAGAIIGVHEDTIRRWCDTGAIKHTKLGVGIHKRPRYRITRAEAERVKRKYHGEPVDQEETPSA
ncbi:MAG: hypothetical protein GFH27_549413n20 [Chloroflexi bacterium AL-W]|nr:hypothetical protein [Chloroflexi bacterium AL-N1]NOK71418.1 hypothetical protein [Chloroflexi bacterium AL-N10]NOK78821.1 hypothetical protein [Chloroflexi bacterium AL-N5]NOK86239.1 hypothetical protein [Chloroflexi bacterium AL-W]NOK93143.1 hypothetical protein [Chloroflexi bacterium AL-N15]